MKPPYFQWAGRQHALLTWTSAMDCWSWSLPAGKSGSCPMENRDTGSICNSCYAQQGTYLFSTTRHAQRARFEFLKSDPDRVLNLITSYINDHRLPYFRVHDSGDFHSLAMIWRWTDAVRRCPDTRFWFPTRAWTFPHWIPALSALAAEPNVSVRPSAQKFDEPPPYIRGLHPGTMSTSAETDWALTCPKTVNHSSCGKENCRTCWSTTEPVNYLSHGHVLTAKERLTHLSIGATS
jgi:hypothetical protein